MKRRQIIQTLGAGSALGALGMFSGCASTGGGSGSAKVVVVGGGFGGAAAAKYIRMWSNGGIQVTLVEPNAAFVSCPTSNLVLNGNKTIADITVPYTNLVSKHGVNVVHDMVTNIDAEKRVVKLAKGGALAYDRLILSPGVDFMWETLPGMAAAGAKDNILHAWKAGPQTVALRKQLEAMPDGGVFAMSIPRAPFRCPPGPYERACLVADYFKKAKPKSKVLILDSNDDVQSKKGLFMKAWSDRYKGIVEYMPKHVLTDVDAASKTLKFDFNDPIKANVLNVIPQMRAGDIAVKSGLATANKRWCEVDFLTHESKAAKNVHVLGDSIQIAPGMPKSGQMANQQAKTCAAAVVSLLTGKEVGSMPIYLNACYSFVSPDEAVHVTSIHRYDAAKKTMLTVPGSGGVSKAASVEEGKYAWAWAKGIWAESLA